MELCFVYIKNYCVYISEDCFSLILNKVQLNVKKIIKNLY